MIPSIVAREARENLLDYLRTTYSLTDEAFAKSLFDFLEGPEGMFRGPYLDVRLPFRRVSDKWRSPLEITPPFKIYAHQERAFERLNEDRGHQPQHTLVTTGTGSGKTECFLYPILDHCWRARQEGREGVKAILLYPMNALATDQAGRIARMIWDDPRLKGSVSAGLYVGGAGSHGVATRDHLVDKRENLRGAPPDILLTNYKMLDFLLMRPEDQTLWRNNGPDTLRFLVLDELHTYDGAQGSDVACLIRRLKARLDTPQGRLCCIGTSATIGEGDKESKDRLTAFAAEIFNERFPTESVITEDRLGAEEALGEEVHDGSHPGPGEVPAMAAEQHAAPNDWLSDQARIWFGDSSLAARPVELGSALRTHDFLRAILRVLGGEILSHADTITELRGEYGWFAELGDEGQRLALDSFLGLLSHARSESDPDSEGNTRIEPFLNVQVQVWIREIRNLMRAVDEETQFRWSSELGAHAAEHDLTPEDEEQSYHVKHMPMLRCRDCGFHGLVSVQSEGTAVLMDSRRRSEIGRAWMERRPTVRIVVMGHTESAVDAGQDGVLLTRVCPACLAIGDEPSCSCLGGEGTDTLAVTLYRELTTDSHPKFKAVCPECASDDGLLYLASRASSLLSVAISHLYQSEFNQDRKLLAFVDAVQDASHRSGFFGARTYRFNLRALIQGMLAEHGGEVPLHGAAKLLVEHTAKKLGGVKAAVPVLVPEDLRQHPDYERFLEKKGEGQHEALLGWLHRRLELEVAFEYGYSVRAGRSLEKTGCSTIAIDPVALDDVASDVAMILANDGMLVTHRGGSEPGSIRFFLVGLLQRLRLRGGICTGLLDQYVREGGKRFMLSRQRVPIGPIFGRDAVLPRFLQDSAPKGQKRSAFDAFRPKPNSLNWYANWAAKTVQVDSDDAGIGTFITVCLEQLRRRGVVDAIDSRQGRQIYGLRPVAMTIVDDVSVLSCSACGSPLRLPSREAKEWDGGVCFRYRCEGTYGAAKKAPETFYTRIFRGGRVARVFPDEHTGLLERSEREAVEERFKADPMPPAGPNLLVCTPTLEMGIDIGDLSAVMLCSVPPTPSNYLQRIGRAGRSTGNALCLTMATTRPHDLFFHAEPHEMMRGQVDPPGCFLDAPDMLKRQLAAFAMDDWAKGDGEKREIPRKTSFVLGANSTYPQAFIEHFERNRERLTRGFLGQFDRDTLSVGSREALEFFASKEQLGARFQDAFEAVRMERARIKKLQERARKREADLERDADMPEDERAIALDEVKRSIRSLSHQFAQMGERYPLNVLTDAGVLPNYAFPEPGVELDSVVGFGSGENRRYESRQYQRPASVAIRELAPFNTFYAEGRRVTVDEIDLGTTAQPLLETWRLCAACCHAEREDDDAVPDSVCPSCGDTDWGDVGQRRSLVYFRRSRSLSGRLEAATSDDGEERQREYYTTLDLIDVRPDHHVKGARLLPELPFGFELLDNLYLRELNCGREDDGGALVAGHPVSDRGFEVCRDCGRVRVHSAASGEDQDGIRHAPTCPTIRNKRKPKIERVYLYREVKSEAIRILLPVAELDVALRQASFKAALRLGLRKHFGGRAPNLQIKEMREPSGETQRHYLVLFDSVPGGTGFLADIWRDDGLFKILELAQSVIEKCRCEDGCYRCVFAYQDQRELPNTSKRVAGKIIGEILGAREGLRDVKTLADVAMSSRLESELEARFIRALVARAQRQGSVRMYLSGGDERWELAFEGARWEVQPQVQLGGTDGVNVSSRPDFVLWPKAVQMDQRPIAVFCDGFAYHVEPGKRDGATLAHDIEKRRAIMESGRFLVWSVTWDDVVSFGEDAIGGHEPLFGGQPSKWASDTATKWGVQIDLEHARLDSMELLWRWIKRPDEARWRQRLIGLGAAMAIDQVSASPDALDAMQDRLSERRERTEAADWKEGPLGPSTTVIGKLHERIHSSVLVTLPTRSLPTSSRPEQGGAFARWTVRIFDDADSRMAKDFKRVWRGFLHAMNLLQFQDDVAFFSTEQIALRGAPYEEIVDSTSEAAERPAVEAEAGEHAVGQPELPQELLDLELEPREQVLAEPIFRRVGLLPELMYELTGPRGRVTATASLAWPSARVAVAEIGDTASMEVFRTEGWKAFEFDTSTDEVIASVVSGETESGATHE